MQHMTSFSSAHLTEPRPSEAIMRFGHDTEA